MLIRLYQAVQLVRGDDGDVRTENFAQALRTLTVQRPISSSLQGGSRSWLWETGEGRGPSCLSTLAIHVRNLTHLAPPRSASQRGMASRVGKQAPTEKRRATQAADASPPVKRIEVVQLARQDLRGTPTHYPALPSATAPRCCNARHCRLRPGRGPGPARAPLQAPLPASLGSEPAGRSPRSTAGDACSLAPAAHEAVKGVVRARSLSIRTPATPSSCPGLRRQALPPAS